jgi:hypothetical protein
MENVRRILETTRDPQFPADVPHAYEDKFTLTEMACKGTIVCTLNALALVGLDEAALEGLAQKVKDDKQRVSLVFAATERCAFNRSQARDVESATQGVKETTGGMFGNKKTTYKTVSSNGSSTTLVRRRTFPTRFARPPDSALHDRLRSTLFARSTRFSLWAAFHAFLVSSTMR